METNPSHIKVAQKPCKVKTNSGGKTPQEPTFLTRQNITARKHKRSPNPNNRNKTQKSNSQQANERMQKTEGPSSDGSILDTYHVQNQEQSRGDLRRGSFRQSGGGQRRRKTSNQRRKGEEKAGLGRKGVSGEGEAEAMAVIQTKERRRIQMVCGSMHSKVEVGPAVALGRRISAVSVGPADLPSPLAFPFSLVTVTVTVAVAVYHRVPSQQYAPLVNIYYIL